MRVNAKGGMGTDLILARIAIQNIKHIRDQMKMVGKLLLSPESVGAGKLSLSKKVVNVQRLSLGLKVRGKFSFGFVGRKGRLVNLFA